MPLCVLSSTSTTARVSMTKPSAPINLTFISATTSSITFSFTPPSGTVNSYSATIVTDDANNTTTTGTTTSGTSQSFTIGSLPKGNQGYKISLTATNTLGTSPASAILRAVTLPYSSTITSITVPSAYDASYPGNNNLLINYTISANNSGSITQFVINNVTNSTNTTVSTPSTRSYYVGSLTGHTSYGFTVTTYHSFTNASSVVTTSTSVGNYAGKYTLPNAPTITGLTNNGPNSMSIAFNIVGPLTYYGDSAQPMYYAFVNGNTDTNNPNSIMSYNTPIDAIGLAASTTYSFTVVAKNSSGYSQFSSASSATTNSSYVVGFNQLSSYTNFEQDGSVLGNNFNSNTVTNDNSWSPNAYASAGDSCSLTTDAARGTRAVKFVRGRNGVIINTTHSTTYSGITICFWFKISSNPSYGMLLIYANRGDGWMSINGAYNDTTFTYQGCSTQFSYNQWYHIAIVFQSKAFAKHTYTNGSYTGSEYTFDPNNTAASGSGKQIYLGTETVYDWDAGFRNNVVDNAYYDEIQTYKAALNQSHISYIYNNTGSWVNF